MLSDLLFRLRSLFRRNAVEQELEEEIASHLKRQIESYVRSGLSQAEAEQRARIAFGGPEQVKEACRDARGVSMIETTAQDVRHALRNLRKSPSFTIIGVGTLALAIGANTAIFSVIEAVILRPLSYQNPARLALLSDGTTYTDYLAWKSQNRSFEDMAVYYRVGGRTRVILSGAGEPESVQGAFVSSNFLPLLDVPPIIGRWFTPAEEAQHDRVIVIAYGLWDRRFGAAPNVIGKSLNIDGINALVIGVMPPSFQFPAKDVQFWGPITTNRYWGENLKFDPNYSRLAYARWDVVARLKPGVAVNQAQTEMATINTRLEQAAPDRNRARTIHLAPLRVNLSGSTRLALYMLFAAVCLVLLIACTNVANLVLARGAARRRKWLLGPLWVPAALAWFDRCSPKAQCSHFYRDVSALPWRRPAFARSLRSVHPTYRDLARQLSMRASSALRWQFPCCR